MGRANHKSHAKTYSYTQISQYITCPRRYRHRYLDGWQERDARAAMSVVSINAAVAIAGSIGVVAGQFDAKGH